MIPIQTGSMIHIEKEEKHRLINSSETELLEIIEVQVGQSFEEDDIIRYQDDYQRS